MLFKKTNANVKAFASSLLKNITQNILKIINNVDGKKGCYNKMLKNGESFEINIENTMRMTVCEIS